MFDPAAILVQRNAASTVISLSMIFHVLNQRPYTTTIYLHIYLFKGIHFLNCTELCISDLLETYIAYCFLYPYSTKPLFASCWKLVSLFWKNTVGYPFISFSKTRLQYQTEMDCEYSSQPINETITVLMSLCDYPTKQLKQYNIIIWVQHDVLYKMHLKLQKFGRCSGNMHKPSWRNEGQHEKNT